MNGDPLPADHGFPARLIVPGLFGYVSATKWLAEIELTTWEAFDAYWVPLGWSKEGPILTQSRIDVPRDGARLDAGPTTIAGVAWAPDRGISAVEVQVDEDGWQPAELATPISDATWVQFVQLPGTRRRATTSFACAPPTATERSRPTSGRDRLPMERAAITRSGSASARSAAGWPRTTASTIGESVISTSMRPSFSGASVIEPPCGVGQVRDPLVGGADVARARVDDRQHGASVGAHEQPVSPRRPGCHRRARAAAPPWPYPPSRRSRSSSMPCRLPSRRSR